MKEYFISDEKQRRDLIQYLRSLQQKKKKVIFIEADRFVTVAIRQTKRKVEIELPSSIFMEVNTLEELIEEIEDRDTSTTRPTAVIRTVREQLVQDREDRSQLCITFFHQKDLNEIYRLLSPVVGGNEYQVMYHSLNIRMNSLYLVFPLLYYSFPQTISSAHIDYQLEDIFSRASETKEEARQVAEKMMKAYRLRQIFPTARFTLTPTNSIHRHPGHFGFSSTDKSKSVDNPGVIYRNKNANELLQNDSVIYCSSSNVEIVTTETRIVSVKEHPSLKAEGTYTEIENVALMLKEETSPSRYIHPSLHQLGNVVTIDTPIDELFSSPSERKETVKDVWEKYEILGSIVPTSILVLLMKMYAEIEIPVVLKIDPAHYTAHTPTIRDYYSSYIPTPWWHRRGEL